MSEKPPKKKLRQTSIIHMFKSASKDSKVMETVDISNKHDEDKIMETEPTAIADSISSSLIIEDQDLVVNSCNQKEKSPQKNMMKKHLEGKSKKERKHVDYSNVKGESSSRETDHKCSFEGISKGQNEPKGSPSEKSKVTPTGSCEASPSKVTWRGCPISSLKTLGSSNRHIPSVHPSSDHTVMVKLPLPDLGPPDPHPSSYSDVWDQHHVRMPCSPRSLYPISSGSDSLVPRWSVICKSLQRDIRCVNDLQKAILEYNTRYAEKWNFKGLQYLLKQEFEEEEHDYFFQHTLPAMISLALDLPNLVTQAPPLLTRHSTHSITISQIQIASLLANAFFCTYPRRNAKGGDTEYATYPDINFNRLFSHKEKRSLEKLKCVINYFRRITTKRPDGLVTFTRQHVNFGELPSWETSSHHLPELHINSSGLIEEMEGLLQVDFANKYIGGGVLGLGCVQEEIRFVLSPELIVSRLFTQVLDKTEALIVTGTEQYNIASGYASTFSWTGSHQDSTSRDIWKRRLCQVVAIDALRFTHPKVQYRPNLIVRELNKVYAGFKVLKGSVGVPVGVATGNWGCGAFNGNPRLKSLIQLAACGYVGRSVAYFTFGDEKLRNDISTMHIFLKENNVTVGELAQILVQYGQREWADGSDLYQYIYHNLGAYESETDIENEGSNDSSNNNYKTKNSSQRQCTDDSGTSASKKISEFFKKTENPRSSTSQSNNGDSFHNHPSSSANLSSVQPHFSETTKEDNLTEDKIVQVLKECDRLVEDQKKKNQDDDNSSSAKLEKNHKDNKLLIEGNDSNLGNGKNSIETTEEKMETYATKTSKSLNESSNLLSSLDEIDKKLVSHK